MSYSTDTATVGINYAIPEAMHRALKAQAAHLGITLKEMIIVYLTESLAQDGEDVVDAAVNVLSEKARFRWQDWE